MSTGTLPYQIPLNILASGTHLFNIVQSGNLIGGAQIFLPRESNNENHVQSNNCYDWYYTELEVYFVNDTPMLNVDTVHAEIKNNRPGANLNIQCHLTHFDFFKFDCMYTVF